MPSTTIVRPAVPAGPVPRVAHELECDRAHEHTAAERHGGAERPLADAPAERDSAACDEGPGGKEALRERSRHEPSLGAPPGLRIPRSG